MRNRKLNRSISLFVLVAFCASLGAPIVEAQQPPSSQPTGGTVSSMANSAVANTKSSLSNLWKVWQTRPVPPGVPANYKPTLVEAFKFFRGSGATPQQAELLANNAQSSGQLASTAMKPITAVKGFISKLFGGGTKAPVESVASSEAAAAAAKKPGFFSRLFGKGGSNQQAAASSGKEAAAAPKTGSSGGFVGKIKGGIDRLVNGGKAAGDKAVLTVKRGADTVATGATTGFLSAKNVLDFNRYYELPLTDSSAIRFRGKWQSTVKFTDGKWTVGEVNATSKWPAGAIKSGEAVARIEDVLVGSKQGKVTQHGLSRAVDKIQNSASSLRDKIFGSKSKTLSKDAAQNLGKLEVQGHLLEQSRAIVDAQKAIKARISTLEAKASSLQKPVPAEQIAALKKGYQTLEGQKQEITRRLDSVSKSKGSQVMQNAATWALYSVGITASINVISQMINGEEFSIKRAFSFVTEPSFWGGTAGGFVGSMLFQTLASSFMPPGAGIFFKVIPGFLGAALGFEVGGGLFGGGSGNLLMTIGQTVASAGGYALAYTLLGGAAAPGFALIGASIAAGAVASFVLGKIFGGSSGVEAIAATQDDMSIGGAVAHTLPAPPEGFGIDDTGAGANTLSNPNGTGSEPSGPAGFTSPSVNAAAASQEMKMAYNEYINHLKERKVADALLSYYLYVKAKDSLDKSRSQGQ